jgi:aryl-alcohol dehydrogenase-like predicted oxidoreductase
VNQIQVNPPVTHSGHPLSTHFDPLRLCQLHPFCQQREIVDYCHQNGIIVQAYSPLIRAQKGMFDHPAITAIANKHGKDNAQVLIRWTLQKGCGFSLVLTSSHRLLTVVTSQVGDLTQNLGPNTNRLKYGRL